MKKKKIIYDSLLNIVATAVPLVVLQLLILPSVAKHLGAERNGTMLAIVSLFSILSLPLGTSFNNVRLLRQVDYEDANVIGDFNICIIGVSIMNAVVMTVMTIVYSDYSVVQIALSVICSALGILNAYFSVYFRLVINYKDVFINHLILTGGYLLGLGLFCLTKQWQWIYIAGYGASILHLFSKGDLHREPLVKTQLFSGTLKMGALLILTNIVVDISSYSDKLIIYPMLGAATVSVYQSASIMGRLFSLAVSPVRAVMLSYIAKMRGFSKKKFVYICVACMVLAVLGYAICVVICPYIVRLLYPQWAEKSISILPYTIVASMLALVNTILKSFVLCFCKKSWLLVINAGGVAIYVLSAWWYFIPVYGLKGLCISVILGKAITVVAEVILFFLSDTNREKDRIQRNDCYNQ